LHMPRVGPWMSDALMMDLYGVLTALKRLAISFLKGGLINGVHLSSGRLH
jgi:hypothetical protein